MKKIIYVAFSIFLFSCASVEGPLYSKVDMSFPDGKARIVVYRIWSLTGAAYKANFFLNGEKIALLNNGGFNYVFVEPGEYVVSHGPDKEPYYVKVSFTAEEGGSYFVGLHRGLPDDIYLHTDEIHLHTTRTLKKYKLQPYKL